MRWPVTLWCDRAAAPRVIGFDYSIIGAGAAGCVCANPLSDDPAVPMLRVATAQPCALARAAIAQSANPIGSSGSGTQGW